MCIKTIQTWDYVDNSIVYKLRENKPNQTLRL